MSRRVLLGMGIVRREWAWLLAWSAIFTLNLIVPLAWAWDITRQGGRGWLVVGCGCVGVYPLTRLGSGARPGGGGYSRAR
jgi:hypothetical protein